MPEGILMGIHVLDIYLSRETAGMPEPAYPRRELILSGEELGQCLLNPELGKLLKESPDIECSSQADGSGQIKASPLGFERLMGEFAREANFAKDDKAEKLFASMFRKVTGILAAMPEEEFYEGEAPEA
ncbi:MAG: hypothetical protein HQL31_04825 [Planctomycetes bacterium]|nr:hypothetical protein [Planctomycetota bacterium]